MARSPRLKFSGTLYHITSRGDRRDDIYWNDDDREWFLDLLAEICQGMGQASMTFEELLR